MGEKQITLRIENTAEQTDSPILLSGPVEIFATLDTIDDLKNSTLLTEIQKYYTEEFEKYQSDDSFDKWINTMPGVIVFVENVNANPDTYTHRGAYFYTKFFEIPENTQTISRIGWQEILLGIHSHENIETLDRFESLEDIGEKQFLVLNTDGKIYGEKISDIVSNGIQIPELPLDVQHKIKEYSSYKKVHEYPEDSEKHHLDADLKDLENTYDHLNTSNLAVGTCRDIYYSLMHDKKRLYIDSNMSLQLDEYTHDLPWVRLSIDEINYSGISKDDVIIPQLINGYYVFKMSLPVEIDDTSEVFLFDNDEIISDSYLQIFSYDNKKKEIIFKISKRAEFVKDVDNHILKLLVVKDISKISGFRQMFLDALYDDTNPLTLSYIDDEITRLYVKNELDKKPIIPKLYLSTDEKGDLVWENTLLPTQTFYKKTKIISGITDTDDIVDITFEDVYFNAKYDYPLLIIDGFIVNLPYSSAGQNIIYKIQIDSDEYHYTIENGTEITLIVIKGASGGAITDELARNYISREEAVDILSRGKLKLDDYAKKVDLNNYATSNHTHAQYSLRGHNHDSRYANFHHTHPELLKAVAELIANTSGGDLEEIKTKLEELSEKDIEKYILYIQGIFRSAGFKVSKIDDYGNPIEFVLYDDAILGNFEVVNAINKKLYNERDPDTGKPYLDYLGFDGDNSINPTEKEPGNVYLKDILLHIVKLFEREFIYDSQVKLEAAIPVHYNVGGVKSGSMYERDTDLRKILTDIFNPYIPLDECVKRMTPVAIKLKWLKLINTDVSELELTVNDFIEIQNDDIFQNSDLSIYFQIDGIYNIYCHDAQNQEISKCEMDTLDHQRDYRKQITSIIVNDDIARKIIDIVDDKGTSITIFKLDLPPLYDDDIYSSPLEKFIKNDQKIKCNNATNMFDNNLPNMIFDSYGIKSQKIENQEGTPPADLEILNPLEWNPAHIYVGTLSDDDIKNIDSIDVFDIMSPMFIDNTNACVDISDNRNIVILLRDDIDPNDIIIKTSYNMLPDMDILQYFVKHEHIYNNEFGISYFVYYYRVYNSTYNKLPLNIDSR